MKLETHYCESGSRVALCGRYPSSFLYRTNTRSLTTCKDCLAFIIRVEREELRQKVNNALNDVAAGFFEAQR